MCINEDNPGPKNNKVDNYFYYIPINVLLYIQAVPSSGIQTRRSYFPYDHSVIFQIRIMSV